MGETDYSYFNTWSSYESAIKNISDYSTVFSPEFILVDDPENPDHPTILSIEGWLRNVFDHDPRMKFIEGIRDGEKVHVVGKTSPIVYVYIKLTSGPCSIVIYSDKGKELFRGEIKDAEMFLLKWSLSV